MRLAGSAFKKPTFSPHKTRIFGEEKKWKRRPGGRSVYFEPGIVTLINHSIEFLQQPSDVGIYHHYFTDDKTED